MAWNDVLQHPLPVLFVLAALALFAMGEFLARKRRAAPARVLDPKDKIMMQLLEAAVAAYKCASREGLAVAKVAEHARDVPSAAIGLREACPRLFPSIGKANRTYFKSWHCRRRLAPNPNPSSYRKRPPTSNFTCAGRARCSSCTVHKG